MKRILFLVLAFFAVSAITLTAQEDFRKSAPKPGPAPKIELGDYERFTLDNGLQVIVVENDKLPRVSFQLFVNLPIMMEGEYSGAANMMGTLLRSGSEKRSKAEIDESIDYLGASLNTNARGMFGTALSKYKEQLMGLMSEVLLMPTFPEEEFAKTKRQTLANLEQVKDDPESMAANVGNVVRYGTDHPYGEIETPETIDKIGREQIVSFYNTYFKPNISYLVMVGDIKEAEAKKLAQQYFGSWQKGEVEKQEYALPRSPAKTQVVMVDRPASVQSVINVTYPVNLKPGTADVLPASVLNTILGSSFHGRLFSNLREDKGYTYGAYSSLDDDEYVGYFNANANVRNEVTDSSVIEFMKELRTISTEKVTDQELTRAKMMLTGSFARRLENPQTIASFALNTARYNLPEDYYQTYLQRLSKVSTEDVLEAAHRYVTPEKANIVIVGSKKDVGEKLNSFDDDGKITYYDAFGRVKDDAAITVPAGLTAEQVIDKYITVIGGKEKLMKVNDLTTTMSANVQGMAMQMKTQYKKPYKFFLSVNANGMAMQEIKFDGENTKMSQMGQEMPTEEGTKEEMMKQALMFEELEYDKLGMMAKLTGAETIDGKATYVVEVTDKDGSTTTNYYSIDTGLKLRSVAQQGPQVQTTNYSDYQAVDGIMFPHKMAITGMAPFPIEMTTDKIEVNTGIDDAVFKVK